MNKPILRTLLIIIISLISFTNLQAELGWKHISNLDEDVAILDVKAFNGKIYVLYINYKKHKLVVSEDKGETWKVLHKSDKVAIFSNGYVGEIIDENNMVYFINDKFMRSSDGGLNWDSIPFNGKHNNETAIASKVELHSISMGDPLNGIAIGRYNKEKALYKTMDGWKNVEIIDRYHNETAVGISDKVNFNVYKMVSKDTIVKVGYYYPDEIDIKTAIAYSFDGGKTYTKFDGIDVTFASISRAIQSEPLKKTKAGFWVLVGGNPVPGTKQNGRVYKCKNLGDKWEEIFFSDEDCHEIMNCDFYDENTGIVNSSYLRYRPYRTYDGGKTWKTDTLFTDKGVYPKDGTISSHNFVCYVDDTPILLSASNNAEVFRLEEIKSIEYDVDTLQQVRLVSQRDDFTMKRLQIKATADAKDIKECWIDLNDNKKREENENLKVSISGNLGKGIYMQVPRKEVTLYGKFVEMVIQESDIDEVYVSKCTTLKKLLIENNILKKNDINLCKNIENLMISRCSELSILDIKKNNNMKLLILKDCPINELYLPEDNNLNGLLIEKSKLKEVDISNFKAGSEIVLNENLRLKKIVTGDNCNINYLELKEANEDIEHMDFSGLKKATSIKIEETNFNEVDLSECKNLTKIEIRKNPSLTKIKLPENEKLERVTISENLLSEVEFKAPKSLRAYSCQNNGGIRSLNFNGGEKLEQVHCYRNQITSSEADKLMESLPDRSGKGSGVVFFIAEGDYGKYKVGNWAYAYSVDKAKAKNWDIQYYPQGDYKGTSSVSEGTMKVFNIYPNPADNILNIPEHETLITDIEIYNSSLDQVKILSPAAKIDISDLPAGVYYIKLNYVMHKFVKK